MKKLRFFLPLAALGLLASCANEEVKMPDQPTSDGDGLYISFNVAGATANTKNTTQDAGESDGSVTAAVNENVLSSVDVYFLDSNDEVLVGPLTATSTESNGTKITSTSADHNVTIKVTDIDDLLPLCKKDVSVVLVGNKGTTGFDYTLNTTTTKAAKSATFASDFSGGKNIQTFGNGGNGKTVPVMSFEKKNLTIFNTDAFKDNSEANKVDNRYALRALFTQEHTGGGKELQISTSSSKIALERGVARIDFKDRDANARKAESDVIENKEFTYIYGTSKAILKLAEIQVFNVNPTSNLFRQVMSGSATSAYDTPGTVTLLGKENGGGSGYNWVTNPDWKSATEFNNRSLLNPFSGINASTVANAKVTPTVLQNSTPQETYYPWIYIPENTVPTTALMTKENLQSFATGLAFKFEVMAADGSTSITTSNKASVSLPNGVRVDGSNLVITNADGKTRTVEITATGTFLPLFVDFLKHNVSESTKAMEYGVVRNNVYQCSIKEIKDANSWDDAETLYLSLEVNVKAWQQRANEFEF